MSATPSIAASLRAALDPVTFAIERLDFEPDQWQAGAMRSDARQQMLNCSRQSGKSTTTAVIALHTAEYFPGSLSLLVSPTQRQTGELFGKVGEFQKRLGPSSVLEEDNRLSFTTSRESRVVSLPGNNPDAIRGFSAPDLVIMDEAAFVVDGLFTAVRPMLAVSGGRLILMSTPNGQQGRFFTLWQNADGWEKIKVTAEQCPRITPEFIEQERRDYGENYVRQEYYCEFLDTADQVFSSSDIARAMSDEVSPLFEDEGEDDVTMLSFEGKAA